MKRTIIVRLECDSDDSNSFIVNDIEQELSCCSTQWKNIEVKFDTESVRHGHWIVDEDGNIECSECGYRGVGYNYCESCGAMMGDEVDKDDLELFNLVRENYLKVNEDYIKEQMKIASSYLFR